MVSCQIPHKRNSIKYENLNIKQRQDAHHCMACLPSWNYQQALRMPLDEVLLILRKILKDVCVCLCFISYYVSL